MAFQDMTLSCSDCGQEFIFSADDQEFHAGRGYQNPKRCSSCRQSRRSEQRGGSGYERPLYDVTCAECGQPTQVPFLPRQDRPVYCRTCYAKNQPSRERF